MGIRSTAASLDHRLWLRSFSLPENELSQTFIATVLQPQRRLQHACLELLFSYLNLRNLFLLEVLRHTAPFDCFRICSVSAWAIKLLSMLNRTVYHFRGLTLLIVRHRIQKWNGMCFWMKPQRRGKQNHSSKLNHPIVRGNNKQTLQNTKIVQLYKIGNIGSCMNLL